MESQIHYSLLSGFGKSSMKSDTDPSDNIQIRSLLGIK